MDITTLFIVSGSIVFLMVVVRMLEIKFERAIILAHLSFKTERKLKPYAKRFFRSVAEKREVLAGKLKAIPVGAKEKAAVHYRNGRLVWERYYEFFMSSVRGKKMLQGGSVSFFLLNISDYDKKWAKGERTTPGEFAEVRIPVERDEVAREG